MHLLDQQGNDEAQQQWNPNTLSLPVPQRLTLSAWLCRSIQFDSIYKVWCWWDCVKQIIHISWVVNNRRIVSFFCVNLKCQIFTILWRLQQKQNRAKQKWLWMLFWTLTINAPLTLSTAMTQRFELCCASVWFFVLQVEAPRQRLLQLAPSREVGGEKTVYAFCGQCVSVAPLNVLLRLRSQYHSALQHQWIWGPAIQLLNRWWCLRLALSRKFRCRWCDDVFAEELTLSGRVRCLVHCGMDSFEEQTAMFRLNGLWCQPHQVLLKSMFPSMS